MLLMRFVFCDCCLVFELGEVGFDLRFFCLMRSFSCCLTMIAIDFSASSSSRSVCVWRGFVNGVASGGGRKLSRWECLLYRVESCGACGVWCQNDNRCVDFDTHWKCNWRCLSRRERDGWLWLAVGILRGLGRVGSRRCLCVVWPFLQIALIERRDGL